jgi:hypothetical protein
MKTTTPIPWHQPEATPITDVAKMVQMMHERGYKPDLIILHHDLFKQATMTKEWEVHFNANFILPWKKAKEMLSLNDLAIRFTVMTGLRVRLSDVADANKVCITKEADIDGDDPFELNSH